MFFKANLAEVWHLTQGVEDTDCILLEVSSELLAHVEDCLEYQVLLLGEYACSFRVPEHFGDQIESPFDDLTL